MTRTSMRNVIGWVVSITILLLTTGCALRRPTVGRFHEASAGLGGLSGMQTDAGSTDAPRYGAGSALLSRFSYAHCLDKESIVFCIEVPADILPSTKISSPSAAAPSSYSSLLVTPGVRFQSRELAGGFLPFNYFGVGIGPVRYVTSRHLVDGTMTTERQRTTMSVVRGEIGLSIHMRNRLSLRTGVVVVGGGLPEWLRESGGVLPEGETIGNDERVGGHVQLSVRF